MRIYGRIKIVSKAAKTQKSSKNPHGEAKREREGKRGQRVSEMEEQDFVNGEQRRRKSGLKFRAEEQKERKGDQVGILWSNRGLVEGQDYAITGARSAKERRNFQVRKDPG